MRELDTGIRFPFEKAVECADQLVGVFVDWLGGALEAAGQRLDPQDRAQGFGSRVAGLHAERGEDVLIALANEQEQLGHHFGQLSGGDQRAGAATIGLGAMAAQPVTFPPAVAAQLIVAGGILGAAANGACAGPGHQFRPSASSALPRPSAA
jgi:hypothetical protein